MLLQALSWGDKTLFGLVRGESRWQLKEQSRTGWMAKRKTLVVLDQEVTGQPTLHGALDQREGCWN